MKKYRKFHYGWIIVLTGCLGVFACIGLGRFALGMLLPSMGEALQLSYSEMGFISTINFGGYLFAALLSGFLVSRFGARRLIFLALVLVGVSMSLISTANGVLTVAILYMLTGIGSGASNVPIMGLVSSWFKKQKRGRAAGFIVIGSGLGLLLSGKLIPFLNSINPTDGWRAGWLVLGMVVVVIAVVCVILLRDRPEDLGLQPLGAKPEDKNHQKGPLQKDKTVFKELVIYHIGVIYFLFGFTYVIYATFIVTCLVKEWGMPEAVAGNLWSWIGLLSLLSGPLFGTLSDRAGRKAGIITVFSIQMVSYLLIASRIPGVFLYLSIGLYGIVAWSIPSIMAAVVGDYVGSVRASSAFGIITFIFGLGQITGPAVAGVLAEKTNSFSSSFYMAAVAVALAILLTAILQKPRTSG
jgi:sugar phosphate permease